jgi:hypothetical protein
MKHVLLSLLLGGFALTSLPLRAADEKSEEAAGESQLDQVKLGEAILNGPVTMESLKGKAVVLEFWGIH